MADYTNLIASIQDVIKENGNNEITGNLLQQTLLGMVHALGEGWQYNGIATPGINPGSPDNKVYYFATTPGTYTFFSGITLASGEVALLRRTTGGWDKVTIPLDFVGERYANFYNGLLQKAARGTLKVSNLGDIYGKGVAHVGYFDLRDSGTNVEFSGYDVGECIGFPVSGHVSTIKGTDMLDEVGTANYIFKLTDGSLKYGYLRGSSQTDVINADVDFVWLNFFGSTANPISSTFEIGITLAGQGGVDEDDILPMVTAPETIPPEAVYSLNWKKEAMVLNNNGEVYEFRGGPPEVIVDNAYFEMVYDPGMDGGTVVLHPSEEHCVVHIDFAYGADYNKDFSRYILVHTEPGITTDWLRRTHFIFSDGCAWWEDDEKYAENAFTDAALAKAVIPVDLERGLYLIDTSKMTSQPMGFWETSVPKSMANDVWMKFVDVEKIPLGWLEVKPENMDRTLKGRNMLIDSITKPWPWDFTNLEYQWNWDDYDYNGITSVYWFGDSIANGVQSPGLQDGNSWLYYLNNIINLELNHGMMAGCFAVSGATFTTGYGSSSIITQIEELNITLPEHPIIIIAGGVNDWQLGRPLGTPADNGTSTLWGALKRINTLLVQKKLHVQNEGDPELGGSVPNTKVTFVTPFPTTSRTLFGKTLPDTLWMYCKTIQDFCLMYGYNCINGHGLGLPDDNPTDPLSAKFFDPSDCLHPTAWGHLQIAQMIAGKLF